jgi:peptidoglycan/LPS O-acetylase OafA/YrhL
MRFVSTPYHGILDYAGGAMLMLAPFVLGFSEINHTAAWASVILGAAIFVQATFTDFEGAWFERLIPMRIHLAVDLVLGLALLAAPFVFDSASLGTYGISFVVAGAGLLVLAAITQTTPLQGSDRAVSREWAQQMRAHNRRLRQGGVRGERGRMARNH